jgi:hypothetical protein
MTVNTNTTRELDIGKVTLRAAQLSGVADPQQPTSGEEWDSLSAMARDFLEMDIDALQAVGAYAREVDFSDLSIVADTASYTLPSTTLNVLGEAMFKKTGETTSTPILPISREQYHRYTDKTITGTPTQYYAERLAVLTVYFYPVPVAAGTVTFQRHRLLGDNDDASKTLDLDRYWTLYVTYSLAHNIALAHNLPVSRCDYLRKLADEQKGLASSYAAQQVDDVAMVHHPTQWSR